MSKTGKFFLLFLCSVFLTGSPSAAFSQGELPLAEKIAVSPEDMFVDLDVSSHRVYVGEFIRIEFDVYVAHSRGQLFYDAKEPDFRSWYVYETDTPRPTVVTVDGKRYTKEPFSAYYVSAIKAGNVELPSLHVDVPYESGKRITNKAHVIEVLLPPEPRPPQFHLKNVGAVELRLNFPGGTDAVVGRPLMWELIVSSDTDTSNMVFTSRVVSSAELEDHLTLYPLKKIDTTERVVSGQYHSETKYQVMVVPKAPGDYTFPVYEMSIFDPHRQKYKDVRTEPFELHVSGDVQEEWERSLPESSPETYPELRKIQLQPKHRFPLVPRWLFVLPPFLFIIFFGKNAIQAMPKWHSDKKRDQARLEEMFLRFESAHTTNDQLTSIREIITSLTGISLSRTVHLEIKSLRDVGMSMHHALALANIYDDLISRQYSGQGPLTQKQREEAVLLLQLLRDESQS